MKEVRIGIVGIGNMGSAHAMQIFHKKVEGLALSAICDIQPKRLEWGKEHFGSEVAYYSDYKELLASGLIDAVIIATPHLLHPVIAVEAFRQGLHVLTEKPAGIDTRSVQRMNQAAIESGKVFCIMYNQRTNPLFAKLKGLIADGTLGEIKRFVWIINNWYRTQYYYNSGSWRATWNGEGGGVLLNQCPHNLDIWQWMMGMPVRLRAFCHEALYHDISVEDDATIYAEYANGATAVFLTSTGEYPGTNRIEVSGTRGKAVLENELLKLYLLDVDEREFCFSAQVGFPELPVTCKEFLPEEPDTGHLGILQNFANAILHGEALLSPGIEGINGLTLSNAAYLSSWTDDWVNLPVDEEKFLQHLHQKQDEETFEKSREIREKTLNTDYFKRWSVQW